MKNINPLYIPVQAAKYANDKYGPFHKPNFVKAATVAAGPLGTIAAQTLLYGLNSAKGSISGYTRNYNYDSTKTKKKPKERWKVQSGYIDDENLSYPDN